MWRKPSDTGRQRGACRQRAMRASPCGTRSNETMRSWFVTTAGVKRHLHAAPNPPKTAGLCLSSQWSMPINIKPAFDHGLDHRPAW